jgi:DNA repair protein RadC
LTIKDWPEQDKPRERLFRLGSTALSDAELLAILIGTGSTAETALEIAQKALSYSEGQYGTSLGFLLESSEEEIEEIPGIGPAKAARLKACAEIGKRLLHGVDSGRKPFTVRRGSEVFEYVRTTVEGLDREHFCILLLNSRNQVIGKEVVSVGSLDASIVHPREIFKNSIKRSAASIVLVHNHPSGDPTPSDDDLEITKRLVEAGRILGIHVMDHVVIARASFVSMRETCPGWFS